jgi:hypothetical protein
LSRAGAAWAWLADNPVLRLSLRRGMRRDATFALLLVYTLALLALVAILYLVVFGTGSAGAGANERMGRLLFLWLALTQTLLLSLTASVLGGSSLSLEREQRTFEALRLTRLSAAEILAGKYLSLLLLLGLLIGTSLPIACLGFLFGGVSPPEVLRATLLTFGSTAAALAVGLASSVSHARSSLANVTAAGVTLIGLIGMPALAAFCLSQANLTSSQTDAWIFLLVVVNPLYAGLHLFLNVSSMSVAVVDLNILVLIALAVSALFWAWARLRDAIDL